MECRRVLSEFLISTVLIDCPTQDIFDIPTYSPTGEAITLIYENNLVGGENHRSGLRVHFGDGDTISKAPNLVTCEM